jgi:hypothetical protein
MHFHVTGAAGSAVPVLLAAGSRLL